MSTAPDHTYEIENVGGIEHARLTLRPGINVLRGENGCGKTSAFKAISRAAGGEVEIERRDGSSHGEIRGGGVVVRIGKVARSSGEASLSLAETSALGNLIDPQIADVEAAARARLRALVELLGLAVDDSAIATLCGGDAAVAAWLTQTVQAEMIADLMVAAEKARGRMHALARDQEGAGEAAAGKRSAAAVRAEGLLSQLGGRPGLVDVAVDSARAAVAEGGRAFERAAALCEGREVLEARQAEIREAIGERPSDAQHVETADRLDREIAGADLAIEELEADLERMRAKIATAREARSGLSAERTAALDAAREAQSAGTRWDEQQSILEQAVEGPTRDDLATLKAELVEGAIGKLAAAESSASYHAAQEEGAEAGKAQETADREGRRLRTLAASIPERLGEILAEAGAPGLTVIGGRIHAITEGGTVDFATRLSDGQRVSIALDVAAHVFGEGAVVPLDGAYWMTLDPSNRAAFADAALKRRLTVLTEEPSDGDLRVEHVGEPQAAAS